MEPVYALSPIENLKFMLGGTDLADSITLSEMARETHSVLMGEKEEVLFVNAVCIQLNLAVSLPGPSSLLRHSYC